MSPEQWAGRRGMNGMAGGSRGRKARTPRALKVLELKPCGPGHHVKERFTLLWLTTLAAPGHGAAITVWGRDCPAVNGGVLSRRHVGAARLCELLAGSRGDYVVEDAAQLPCAGRIITAVARFVSANALVSD